MRSMISSAGGPWAPNSMRERLEADMGTRSASWLSVRRRSRRSLRTRAPSARALLASVLPRGLVMPGGYDPFLWAPCRFP